MVIGSISGMAKKSMGTQAFIAVAVMAIGNAAGRIIAGLALGSHRSSKDAHACPARPGRLDVHRHPHYFFDGC